MPASFRKFSHTSVRDATAKMCRGLIAVAVLVMSAASASAQSSTVYDARTGKVLARSTTGSAGAVTIFDAAGRVTARAATSGSTTTIYDGPTGRVLARENKR